MGQIKKLGELAEIVSNLKEKNKKIVHCHGVFDLLHPGHIEHLEDAKKQGDVLVVTLTKDEHVNKGPERPYFNQELRAKSLAALSCVDYVTISEGPSAVETIEKIKPDFYVKGSEFVELEDETGNIKKEKEAVERVGGKIHFTEGIVFSSSKLLNSAFDVFPNETKQFLKNFQKKYSSGDIIKRLEELKGLKALIIGDTIIDEYHYCEALDKPPKDIMISVKYKNEETFAGGTLAIANHVAGFCNDVHLVTCLGNEKKCKEFIEKNLKKNISTKFFYRDDAPTVVKRRYVEPVFLNKLFEVCFVNDAPLPEKIENDISKYIKEKALNYDLVIVSDFGHGFIGKGIINALSENSKFLAVAAQTNESNMGFNMISKYSKADYVCLNEPEMRLAVHDKYSNLEELVKEMVGKFDYKKIVVTRGHNGSLTYDGKEFYSVPIFSRKVVDRIGASDAYLSVTAPCAARGYPIEVIGFVGNVAGAIAVQTVGNKEPLEAASFHKFIKTLLNW